MIFKPIVHPGTVQIPLKIDLHRGFQNVGGNVTIVRTVSGLALPIRCFLLDTGYWGGCNYNDLCQGWKSYWAESSPSYIEDLQCPFNIPSQLIEASNAFDLPDF